MPHVAPLRGLTYALDRFGVDALPERIRLPGEGEMHPGRVADVTDLACPPYDVIDEAQRAELLARHPRNAVRVELSAERDPHAAAAAELAAWREDGTLERREASVYYYGHSSAADVDEPAVQGILARVRLEEWGGSIKPHEHTLPGPKVDRLGLLRATRTQLSPILAVYFDGSERYRHVMSRSWSHEWRARDADGLLHTLVEIEPDDRLLGYLARQTFFIADGHHRYETALAHQAEVRADPALASAEPGSLAADWIMMVLVNAELEELEIRPTHRLLRDADAGALRALAASEDPIFQGLAMAPDALPHALEERRHGHTTVFGLVLPGDEGYLLVADAEALADRMRRERSSTAVQRLDLAALHAAILHDRLGIDASAVAAGNRLHYTRDASEAIARTRYGEVSAAILVRPTPLEQLAAVARAGDVMPQKSTYFYPKLLTGMVFYPLED